MDAKEEIISWLRDAYAMERSQEMALEEMSMSGRHSSECRTSAAMHLTETRQHAQLVESLLRSLGSDTSTFKTSVGMIAETMKGLGTAEIRMHRNDSRYPLCAEERIPVEEMRARADMCELSELCELSLLLH